jgi:hypothetical protein
MYLTCSRDVHGFTETSKQQLQELCPVGVVLCVHGRSSCKRDPRSPDVFAAVDGMQVFVAILIKQMNEGKSQNEFFSSESRHKVTNSTCLPQVRENMKQKTEINREWLPVPISSSTAR